MNEINKYLKLVFTKRVAIHFAPWFTLLCLLIILESRNGEANFMVYVRNEIFEVLFYAAIYYINSEYLIPKFLAKNEVWRYLGLLFLTAIVLTPIKIMVLYNNFHDYPISQESLLAHQPHYYFISLATAGVSTIIKITTDWAKQIQRQHELETRAMQSELNLLKSQINPHFLFNTLNSLYAMSLKKSDDAPEIVIRLSEMMRYMLYECNVKQVPLGKEIMYIENYLFLEKLRHKNTHISFTVEGKPDNLMVAPLLFMAFIENAFKHGAGNHLSEGFVHIQMLIQDEEVNMFIENSKTETHPTQEHKRSGGIGLVNVKRRLTLLYPDAYNLEISDEPLSYGVNLWLNLNPNAALQKSLSFKLFDKLPLRTRALLKLKDG